MKRTTHLITLLLSILLMAEGCKNTSRKQENPLRVITLKGPSAISMVQMIDQMQYMNETPLTFQIKTEPIHVTPLLYQKKADFAVVPTNMASILYNKDVPYQLAAVPVWGTLYLFGQDTLKNWQELKGKKIHLMAKGMTPDVMFRYLLEQHQIDPRTDVELDYSFPTHIELANAIASGKASMGVISEPMVSMVMEKNKHVHSIFSLNDEWKKVTNTEIPQTALLVSKKIASQHPEKVNQFLQEYRKSIQWVNEHAKEAGSLIVKHRIMNNEHAAIQSIPRCNMHYESAWDIKENINHYLEIFYRMNPDIIGGKLPDENFYYQP